MCVVLVAGVVAYEDSHHQVKHIPILKSEQQMDKHGNYQFEYETGNGIKQATQGFVKNAGQKDQTVGQEGYYSYIDEHGHQVGVHYIADEHGFRATGDHLPTPPPIPHEIQEALAWNAANPHEWQEEQQQYEKEQKPKYAQYN